MSDEKKDDRSDDTDHAEQARRLLTAGLSFDVEPSPVLVRVVARFLADRPASRGPHEHTATAELAGAASEAASVTDAPDGERAAGETATAVDAESLRSWAVSAALLHHTAMEATTASDRLHNDLQEYLANSHRRNPR